MERKRKKILEMRRFLLSLVLIFSCQISISFADNIRIVGSSTMFPILASAAEEFHMKTGSKTPIIESIGTGGGFKLFCSVGSGNRPDMVNASREIKPSELALCQKNGVRDIKKVKIGFDGIVLANLKGSIKYSLDLEALAKAIGKYIPTNDGLVENNYKNWGEIDPFLPNQKIAIYGPPATSGTRDSIIKIVLKQHCMSFPGLKGNQALIEKCSHIRDDGVYREMGENDNIIVHKLIQNHAALGILGYNYLINNSNFLQASLIGGNEPDFNNIKSGRYPLSRSLYVYIDNEKYKQKKELREFIKVLISKDMIGKEGYLLSKGLIPLNKREYKRQVGGL